VKQLTSMSPGDLLQSPHPLTGTCWNAAAVAITAARVAPKHSYRAPHCTPSRLPVTRTDTCPRRLTMKAPQTRRKACAKGCPPIAHNNALYPAQGQVCLIYLDDQSRCPRILTQRFYAPRLRPQLLTRTRKLAVFGEPFEMMRESISHLLGNIRFNSGVPPNPHIIPQPLTIRPPTPHFEAP
jgi:hypothetical protein